MAAPSDHSCGGPPAPGKAPQTGPVVLPGRTCPLLARDKCETCRWYCTTHGCVVFCLTTALQQMAAGRGPQAP